MFVSDHAEALAALGSALVAFGGTLLSHVRANTAEASPA
jgi:predicted aconitase